MMTLETLDEKIEKQIGNLGNKIELIFGLFGGLNLKMEGLDGKFNELGAKVATLDSKVTVLDGRVTSLDMKVDALDAKFETKFDEFGGMMAREFSELRNNIGEVEERLEHIEEDYVTKNDLLKFGRNIDLMLDKHIGVFRKDTNDHARRIKNIEKVVFVA